MIETYIPLYRKYRPQSFHDLVGQEVVSKALGYALAQGKIAHAYLLTGPRGTGKTSTARILAKSLNCEQGPTISPCQVCASCEGITVGNALDVIEFDAASNNSVEQARELIESCKFAPMAGRYKIYIIDEVHMLSTAAFNALLKTLEEPPPGVIFIFATTEAHKVLPTIISRCQRFDFQRLGTPQLLQHLQNVCQQENIVLNESALGLIARSARGGMRDALSQLDQLSVLARATWEETQSELSAKQVADFLGLLGEDALVALTDAVAHSNAEQVLSQLKALNAQGVEAHRILQNLTQHWRALLLVKAYGDAAKADTLDITDSYLLLLQQQAPLFSAAELPLLLHKLGEMEAELRRTADPQLWLEVGLLGLAFRENIRTLEKLEHRLAVLEAKLAAAPLPTQSPNELANRPVVQAAVATPAASVPYKQPSYSAAPSGPPPFVPTTAFVPAQPSVTEPSSPPLFAPIMPPSQLQSAVSQATPVGVSPVTSSATPKPSLASPTTSQNDLSALHQTLCHAVASVPTKVTLLQQTWLHVVNEKQVVFACASKQIVAMLEKPEKLKAIQLAVDTMLGAGRTLRLEVGEKEAAPKKPEREAAAFASSLTDSSLTISSSGTASSLGTASNETPLFAALLPSTAAPRPELQASSTGASALSQLESAPLLESFNSPLQAETTPSSPSTLKVKEEEKPSSSFSEWQEDRQASFNNLGDMLPNDANEEVPPPQNEAAQASEKAQTLAFSSSVATPSLPLSAAPLAPSLPALIVVAQPDGLVHVQLKAKQPQAPTSSSSGELAEDWPTTHELILKILQAKRL